MQIVLLLTYFCLESMFSDFYPSCALLWRAESDGRPIGTARATDYARPAATARRMCRGSTPPQNPSFRGLVRSLLCAMLLPQWMRGAVSSMADSMLALFALSLGAPAAAVGAIVGAAVGMGDIVGVDVGDVVGTELGAGEIVG